MQDLVYVLNWWSYVLKNNSELQQDPTAVYQLKLASQLQSCGGEDILICY